MPVEERSLTSRGVRKRGKAWLLARAYQSLSEPLCVGNSSPYHTRKRDLVGKPDAGNPHVRFDERGTGNAVKGAEL